MDSGKQGCARASPDTLNPVPKDTPTSVDESPPFHALETPPCNGHGAALARGGGDQNTQVLPPSALACHPIRFSWALECPPAVSSTLSSLVSFRPLCPIEYLLYPSTSLPPPPHSLIFLSPYCFFSPAHAPLILSFILLSSFQLSSYSSSKTALPKEQAHCLLPAGFPSNSSMSVFLNYCHGVFPSHGSDSTHSGVTQLVGTQLPHCTKEPPPQPHRTCVTSPCFP